MKRLTALALIGLLGLLGGCGAADEAKEVKDGAEKKATIVAVDLACKGAKELVEQSGGSPSEQMAQVIDIVKPQVDRVQADNPELAAHGDEFIVALYDARTNATKFSEAKIAGDPAAAQLRAGSEAKLAEARRVANEYGFGECAKALDIPLD